MAKRKKRQKSTWRSQWGRKYKRNKKIFFEKLGRLALFIFVFVVLLGGIVYKIATTIIDYSVHYEERLDEQEKQEFLEALLPTAQELESSTGVLAEISLAQAALESNFGRSQLAAQYYNLYGVKAGEGDPNQVQLPTLEYLDDEWHEVEEPFKVYQSWQQSMEEHARLLQEGTSWNASHYHEVLEGKDYKTQAQALQDAGYATDPTYADKLIQLIEYWQLDKENPFSEE